MKHFWKRFNLFPTLIFLFDYFDEIYLLSASLISFHKLEKYWLLKNGYDSKHNILKMFYLFIYILKKNFAITCPSCHSVSTQTKVPTRPILNFHEFPLQSTLALSKQNGSSVKAQQLEKKWTLRLNITRLTIGLLAIWCEISLGIGNGQEGSLLELTLL